MPFAAFRIGLSSINDFVLPRHLMASYMGFPPTLDIINGLIWRITGNVNYANLVNVFALGLFALFLSTNFRVPIGLALLGLLAIPIVQPMATTLFPDVFSNALFCMALISLASYLVEGNRNRQLQMLATCSFCLVAAANSKPQFVILSGLVMGCILIHMSYVFLRKRVFQNQDRTDSRHDLFVLAVLILATIGVYWVPLRNLIFYGNPIFPMEVSVAGHILPGAFKPDNWREPLYLEHTMQPVRWLLSVLEYHAFDGRPLPYTLGQGDVPGDSMSSRMGGFFFPLVAASLTSVGCMLRQRVDAFDRAMLAIGMLATLVVAFLPGSHELRYYSFWMMFLVAYALILASRQVSTVGRAYFISLLITFCYVINMTGGTYLLNHGPHTSD
jgi:hypothetical protein